MSTINNFAVLFKRYRLLAGFASLREFSDAMSEIGQIYDTSYYSHLQNGTRKPTRKMLLDFLILFAEKNAFNDINEIAVFLSSINQGGLTSEEAEMFKSKLRKKDNGVKLNTTTLVETLATGANFYDAVDLLRMHHVAIKTIREHGQLHLVMTMVDTAMRWINNYEKRERNDANKKILSLLAGDLLYEKAYTSGCIFPANENIFRIRTIIQKQTQIAREYKSHDLYVKAFIPLAFSYYALAQSQNNETSKKLYAKSIDLMQKALQNNIIDDTLQLICLRTLAVSSIYIGDSALFLNTESKIYKAIRKNASIARITYIVWALDTIARGRAHFGYQNALDILEEGKKYDQTIPWRDPLRETSMLRNEIEILNHLNATSEKHYVTQLAKKGYEVATQNKIYRYQDFFAIHI